MIEIPRMALAVRQPWAWAIFHGKDVENRSWKHWKRDWRFRGRITILASKGMTQDEYADGRDFMADIGVACPPPAHLVRGGIIGHVNIVDNVWKSNSPWFVGPGAFVLADPVPLDWPIPVDGQLDIFEWKPADRPVCEPLKWMGARTE